MEGAVSYSSQWRSFQSLHIPLRKGFIKELYLALVRGMSRGRCAPQSRRRSHQAQSSDHFGSSCQMCNSKRGKMVSSKVVEILIDKEDRSWGTLAKVPSFV